MKLAEIQNKYGVGISNIFTLNTFVKNFKRMQTIEDVKKYLSYTFTIKKYGNGIVVCIDNSDDDRPFIITDWY
jgi:hypothetical protein